MTYPAREGDDTRDQTCLQLISHGDIGPHHRPQRRTTLLVCKVPEEGQ